MRKTWALAESHVNHEFFYATLFFRMTMATVEGKHGYYREGECAKTGHGRT